MEKAISELQENIEREQQQKESRTDDREKQGKQENDVDRSQLLKDGTGLLDPPYLRPELNAQIVKREQNTDPQFNRYLVITVKNNYSKTIRSLRFRSEWNDKSQYERDRRVDLNWGNEVLSVSIAPGQTKQVIVRDVSMGVYIEAINFTDGSMSAR